MGTWNSRGLRGSTLEDMINHSNEVYREKKLALIQKVPTPVDYIGTVQGIPVCFDAKECAVKTFPLQNVHPHQVQFMKEFEEQGGISFIILYWKSENEIVYLPFEKLYEFWKRMEDGGRKSFTYDEIDHSWQIGHKRDVLVHYLEPLQRDLTLRDAAERNK